MPPNNEIITIQAKYWADNISECYGGDIEDAPFISSRTLLLENHGNVIIDNSQYSISIKYPNIRNPFPTTIIESRIRPHDQGTLDICGLPRDTKSSHSFHEIDGVEVILSRRDNGHEISRTVIEWVPPERV